MERLVWLIVGETPVSVVLHLLLDAFVVKGHVDLLFDIRSKVSLGTESWVAISVELCSQKTLCKLALIFGSRQDRDKLIVSVGWRLTDLLSKLKVLVDILSLLVP